MKKNELCLEPHHIDKNTWWYEEGGGKITLVREVRRDGKYITTEQIFVNPKVFICGHKKAKKS